MCALASFENLNASEKVLLVDGTEARVVSDGWAVFSGRDTYPIGSKVLFCVIRVTDLAPTRINSNPEASGNLAST